MAPRQDISEQRRQEIMDAALAVFSRLGFEHASMDDIAKEAGVSKGALYLYYKSKDAIIATLLQIFFDHAFNQLRELAAAEDSVVAQLQHVTRQLIREMDRMASIQPLTLQFYAIAARRADVRGYLRTYFAEYVQVLEDIMRRGIAQGELRATINPTEAAITLTGLYEGLALLWIIDPQRAYWHAQVESSVSLLLRALMAAPDEPPA